MRLTKPITAAMMITTSLALLGPATGASAAPERPTPCSRPPRTPPEPKPTTVDVVGQAYFCVLANYYSGPVLDSRAVLPPAFAALTRELQRRGLDRADAAMPALTGSRDADWAAVEKVLDRIVAGLPAGDADAVAKAAITGMVESLNDNHANWRPAGTGRPKQFGLRTSGYQGPGMIDPVGGPPLFVTDLAPGGPADKAGIRPGDEIALIDGVPPYVGGTPLPAVIDRLRQGGEDTVTLRLRRPATGAAFTARLARAELPGGGGPRVRSRLLSGDVAYVGLPGFFPDSADAVLAAIEKLREGRTLRGVVLDLRGNGGGSPQEVARLLGAWAHGKIISYGCTVQGRCTPNRTDDSVALLNLPLVTLTDRGCASACDAFSSAVKDLRLGTLVGTRTAGVVAGPASPWILDDGSQLVLPTRHEIAANREIINTIGVPPDHQAPLTAGDLSAGRDPGVAKALAVLRS